MAFDADLERRIREQLDRDEILRVLMRYARGLDRLDNALARSCYWDDAIEDHGNYVGRPDDFISWAARIPRESSANPAVGDNMLDIRE